MKYAVFSDVHANAEALRRIIDDARKNGAERFVCLGDIVGYGPEPAESVRIIRDLKATTVAGNHDDAVSGRLDTQDFNDLAADSVARHRAEIPGDARNWLSSLPYSEEFGRDALAVHGDASDPKAFNYINTEDDAAANFACDSHTLVFVGHTHVPMLFLTGKSGRTYKTSPQDFVVEQGKRYIVNVGSVGYPRESDGKCLSSYVLYDSSSQSLWFRFLPFSVASVMQRGKHDAQAAHKPDAARRTVPFVDREQKRQNRIAKLAFAALAILAIAIFLAINAEQNSKRNPTTTATARITVNSPEKTEVSRRDSQMPLRKSLLVSGKAKSVKANLFLAHSSPPVRMNITFLGENALSLDSHEKIVKKSSTKSFPLPKGTRTVLFTLTPASDADSPSIASFDPNFD